MPNISLFNSLYKNETQLLPNTVINGKKVPFPTSFNYNIINVQKFGMLQDFIEPYTGENIDFQNLQILKNVIML